MQKKPPFRNLRGYAFDPSLSLNTETVSLNQLRYQVEWEDLVQHPTKPGKTVPVGEYLEIIDYDPASQAFYEPVDLDDKYLLAQDGLEPSVGNPQFHQQMVYAVIMTTIRNFEAALGRKIQWADMMWKNNKKSRFVRRLRVYPHALRQPNAYYNPLKKALLFGYFPASPVHADIQMPGGTVFTCLSHDIAAHETTHAILDGLHRRYVEPSNPDTRAFHEAFADIVALFQHFTFPEVLKHQIAKTRGDLASQNLLGQLAQEFGKGVGKYGSLRDAIGHTDPVTNKWVPHVPSPDEYNTTTEVHARGAILVAAIFDAFLNIYKRRIKKLLRVATNGSGLLPEGDLHPDLVELLAGYASETASRTLRICVQAIDYCPPIDVTFGDYLRAIITADVDMVPEDKHCYRIAFIEAFQKRGIFPVGVKSMSIEALTYEQYPELEIDKNSNDVFFEFLHTFKQELAYTTDREKIHETTRAFIGGGTDSKMGLHDRINVKFIESPQVKRFSELTGLRFPGSRVQCESFGYNYSGRSGTAAYAVDKMWLASRISPDGKIINNVIVTIVQKRGVVCRLDGYSQFTIDGYVPPDLDKGNKALVFRGGCTLIYDLDTLKLKYAIKKDMDDLIRLETQFRYMNSVSYGASASAYFKDSTLAGAAGPFAFMHTYDHNH